MSRGLAAVAAAVLLGGCAHIAVEEQNDGLSFAERQMRLEALPAWQMRGRLAVSTNDRAFPGSFTWVQNDNQLKVSVRGPLGQGILEVAGSPAELTVKARGEQHVLKDPEADLSQLLGWWMPVESLPEWLLGLPDPKFGANLDFGRGGTLESFDQRFWHVVYEGYQLVDGMLVPRRIEMTHADLRLKLTVDAWQPLVGGTRALN
jgi:outer membrane lipoprotein LolB